jgi:hypothetical protein
MDLEGNESAKVLVRLQAQDFFAESPRMLIRTASVVQTLKLPITILRICHPPSRESPSETLSALSSYAISDDFNGMKPEYTRMTQIIEAISYEGRFLAYTAAKVPALGKAGVLICAECLGQDVACKVVLRPDASGGTITCFSSNATLRKELLAHLKATLSPSTYP